MTDEALLFAELKAAERLPSPQGVALKVLELTAQEDTPLEDIARLIQADPAMSAKVLKFANSPLIAPRRPIVAVHEALIRIGLNAARALVLSLSLLGPHPIAQCSGFDYPRFWAKSLARAVAMSKLAERQRLLAPEEAFVLGLLARVGELALATAWPEEYARCLTEAKGADVLALERKYFALDSQKLTLFLFTDWKLPEVFANAVAVEHAPKQAGDSRTQAIASQLALAGKLADWCLGGEEPDLSLIDLPHEQAPEFLQALKTAYHAWGKLLEVQTDFPSPKAEAKLTTPSPGLDILLVDDDPVALARLKKPLEQAGHKVRTCQSGHEALKLIFDQPPQLILTDWTMQPMDGLSLCRALRESELGKRLYVIMLTANESEDDLVQAFAVGIDDYLTKPVNLKVLCARLRAGQRIIHLQEELAKERAELELKAKELTLLSRKLEQLANTDLLTGLPNRRYAQRRLAQELAQGHRYGRPVSVMVLDLDYFKSINDSLGHAAGDEVLKHAASVMQNALRASDVLCRWGGEEFLAIVPNADLASAAKLAERLRAALSSQQPKGLALKRPVTVSIGVGSCPPARDLDSLLHAADHALYRAKERGRNRVET
ncbi:MAG: diguanylate cyclase [Methylohalobius sp.]|nr:diguanylate cyclase [Methylohalobius sp.]